MGINGYNDKHFDNTEWKYAPPPPPQKKEREKHMFS